jgi:hypothetical protein
MKDRHLIAERGGRYSVRSVSLSAIKAELGDGKGTTRRKPKARRASKQASKSVVAGATASPEKPKAEGRRSSKKKSGNLAERFDKWIDEGFCDTAKALSDLQKRFHKEAILVPRTSIPTYLLKAVRSGRLVREKGEANGKSVWVYRREA